MHPPPASGDTDRDVFRRQVERWRSMSPVERLELADQLSADVAELAMAAIRFERPDATSSEIRYELTRRRYGSALAEAACGTAPTA